MKPEKMNFTIGVALGIAAVSFIGFLIMAAAYINKNSTNTDVASKTDKANVAKNLPTPPPTPPTPPTAPPKQVNIQVADSDHIRGNQNAKITIVEYSDFQCPYCQRFHDTMKQVNATYGDDIRWVYKHFPLSSHPFAQKAAEASECAADQNKFWEYTDELYANQKSISEAYLSTVATKLNLNSKTFSDCLTSGKYTTKVKNDFDSGRQNGVTGTPGSFINGQLLKGAVPFSQIESMIKQELN